PASYWEIAIKIRLQKYTLSQPYEAFMQQGIAGNGFLILPIEPRHTVVLTTLPFHHRDPFDRLIIAQAMVEQISVISGDAAFAAYPVTCIWQEAKHAVCTTHPGNTASPGRSRSVPASYALQTQSCRAQ